MSQPFEELVAKYHALVKSLILRYYGGRFRDQVEDISQEVWTKLWENFKKNENNIVNFKSYLYRTVQTTLWDAAQSLEKSDLVGSLDESEEQGLDPDEDKAHLRMVLDRLVDRLSVQEARMIKAHLKGFNNGEIAILLDCSEGRVRSLLTRIKKKLVDWGKT